MIKGVDHSIDMYFEDKAILLRSLAMMKLWSKRFEGLPSLQISALSPGSDSALEMLEK
jgi:hypothetical protein